MTAVEWLEIHWAKNYDFDDLDLYLIEQAKEMEKEQIKDAYNKGEFNQGCNGDSEQYYNETFKSE